MAKAGMHIVRPLAGALLLLALSASAQSPIGTTGRVGCLDHPKKIQRLEITRPGVYENFLLDGRGAGGNLDKITAGYEHSGEHTAPAMDILLQKGFTTP